MIDGKPLMGDRRERHDARLRNLRGRCSTHLHPLARSRLRLCYGRTISITGTVGTRSTKDAVVCVLKPRLSVNCSAPDYDTELGLLLSLFRQTTGEEDPKS